MKGHDRADVDVGKTALQQESVWDYPRPPRLETTERRLRVVHGGIVVAETRRGIRILETSHPPVYYIPPADIVMRLLRPSARRGSFCEFKGVASYWDLDLTGDGKVPGVAWSYGDPSRAYVGLRDYLAFYASKVDECWVDEERVLAQPGDFYGGWITSNLKGPFKGAPGTMSW
jgi:uncharacterized protein (DUF427 family)